MQMPKTPQRRAQNGEQGATTLQEKRNVFLNKYAAPLGDGTGAITPGATASLLCQPGAGLAQAWRRRVQLRPRAEQASGTSTRRADQQSAIRQFQRTRRAGWVEPDRSTILRADFKS